MIVMTSKGSIVRSFNLRNLNCATGRKYSISEATKHGIKLPWVCIRTRGSDRNIHSLIHLKNVTQQNICVDIMPVVLGVHLMPFRIIIISSSLSLVQSVHVDLRLHLGHPAPSTHLPSPPKSAYERNTDQHLLMKERHL